MTPPRQHGLTPSAWPSCTVRRGHRPWSRPAPAPQTTGERPGRPARGPWLVVDVWWARVLGLPGPGGGAAALGLLWPPARGLWGSPGTGPGSSAGRFLLCGPSAPCGHQSTVRGSGPGARGTPSRTWPSHNWGWTRAPHSLQGGRTPSGTAGKTG